MELFLKPPFDRLWEGQDPFVAVEALNGHVYRSLEGRRTLCSRIGDRNFFVKIHRGIGWKEIVKNLLSWRLPVLGADNEWRALQRLHELDVPTMNAVAFGCRGWNPACRHSFIVTEDLGPTLSLEDVTREWRENPPPLRFKRDLIREVALMSRAMHQGGVNHRDFYLCHFLMHEDPHRETGMRLFLIDLHRAQVRSRVPRRWRDKDLAGLYFSALEIGLTQRDLLRFLKIYFEKSSREILTTDGSLLLRLQSKAERLAERFRRKYADGVPS